ncbi:MAG: DUF4184 family protein [Planctomycetes bacterium]|nr:DUF4184 family protein [Planctomycetota bacterium]
MRSRGHGGRPIPFTPFHLGPGLLVKASSPRHFWLTSFALANVLIDIEVLYYLRRNDPPIHRYLHTYAGGIAMGLLAGLLMFGVVQLACRLLPARSRWIECVTSTPRPRLLSQSLVAGVIGGVSHVLLDSFMHHDMNPLWPIVDGNPLAGTIGVATLHIGLVLAGFFGLVLWLLLRES